MKTKLGKYSACCKIIGMATLFLQCPLVSATEVFTPRNAYYGDLHLHTRYSNDAFYLTTEEGLDEAYNYAKGKPVVRNTGQEVQIKTPLDFLAVTEHAEFLGALQSFTDPDHPLFNHEEFGVPLRTTDSSKRWKVNFAVEKTLKEGAPIAGYDELKVSSAVWKAIVDAADRHYEPGKFTTLAAYEWTSYIEGGNMHRNIIYKDTQNLPLPFTAEDATQPEELWSFMDRARSGGAEVIAIPHNSNVSDGRMFTVTDSSGGPIDGNYAERRSTNEPVVEITQNKGTSETHPSLSPDDPFSDFEIFPNLLTGSNAGEIEGSYTRQALLLGVKTKRDRDFNPLMFGFVGATDSHSAFSMIEEDNVSGFGGGNYDPTPESRFDRVTWNGLPYLALSASGLTGVWAPENTREQIFEAFKRRETFATTGPRIRVRVFAGWDYQPELLERQNWEEQAYKDGVPMGSVLKARQQEKAPRFLIWAQKDPNGANLDRIQIIKGWATEGKQQVKILDVALSDGRATGKNGEVEAVGNTVNIADASYTNEIGASELKTLWIDPDFDPDVPAFYYARVIEIPTPRWSTYDAKALEVEVSEDVPAWLQERAFASPIWYEPQQ